MSIVIDARTCFASSMCGLRWFEVDLLLEDGSKVRKDITMGELKRLGVAKSLRAWNKVNHWLSTKEGRAYMESKLLNKADKAVTGRKI